MDGINFGITGPASGPRPPNTAGVKDTGEGGAAGGFLRILDEVNRMQNDATRAVEQLSTGESQDIHHAILAAVKAELGVQFMVQVRDRLVQGMQEILRMQM